MYYISDLAVVIYQYYCYHAWWIKLVTINKLQ